MFVFCKSNRNERAFILVTSASSLDLWRCGFLPEICLQKNNLYQLAFFPFFFFVKTLIIRLCIYIYTFLYTHDFISIEYMIIDTDRYTLGKLPSLKITGCFRERNDAVFHHDVAPGRSFLRLVAAMSFRSFV